MAGDIPIGPYVTFPASTGLVQYTFVGLDNTGKLIKPPTSGKAIGVLVSSGSTGGTRARTQQSVQVQGVAKVVVGSTVLTYGDTVAASTLGRASTRGTKPVVGICLDDALTAQSLVRVLLQWQGSTATF